MTASAGSALDYGDTYILSRLRPFSAQLRCHALGWRVERGNGKISTEHLYLPSMADFLWMGASQQEHQDKDECRSHERKIRRFRYGISSQIVFDHDQPPSKGN